MKHDWNILLCQLMKIQSCIVPLLFTQTSNIIHDNIVFLFLIYIRLCESIIKFSIFQIRTYCYYYLNGTPLLCFHKNYIWSGPSGCQNYVTYLSTHTHMHIHIMHTYTLYIPYIFSHIGSHLCRQFL